MAKRVRLSTYHLPLSKVPANRYQLANPELAMVEAKKALTRSINKARGKEIHVSTQRISGEGASLKKGVVAFAQKAGMPKRMLAKLEKMGERELLIMYDENEILFESYFDYGEIEDVDGIGYRMTAESKALKRAQMQQLIDAYERRFTGA